LYKSYIHSRVPAEAITIATLTYASAMKYSAVLTSATCEKNVQGLCYITWQIAVYKDNHAAS